MKPMDNPSFILIGSMKSGTTSLFEDMTRHSGIYSPTIKEPGDLCSDEVLNDQDLKNYFRSFTDAQTGQWIGEASTSYTRFPHASGVPERAKAVYGPELKLIFIGRDPLERLRSHYRHDVQRGTINYPLSIALERDSAIKDVSRYDMQLEKWLKIFPREQILVLHMRDYIDNPSEVVRRTWSFLGLASEEMQHGVTPNVSAGKREPRGMLRSIVRSRIYGLYVKKLLSAQFRKFLRNLLVPQHATTFDDELPPIVVNALVEEFESQTRLFSEMVEEDRTRFFQN